MGDSTITQEEFAKELSTHEAAYGRARGAGTTRFFSPPKFAACVKDERRSGIDDRTASVGELRRQCELRFAGFKRETLESMIEWEWLHQEATARGIKVSASSDLGLLQVKLLKQDVAAHTRAPSEVAIERYYRAHKRDLIQPERRDVAGFLTATEGAALKATRSLREGQSWEATARRYAITKQLHRSVDQVRGDEAAPVARAVFDAPRNAIRGPVDTLNGWYVFRVERIRPAFQMSLEQSVATIKDFLATNAERRAHYALLARFRAGWRQKTRCVGALKVSHCGNGPRLGGVETVSHQNQLNRPVLPVIRLDDDR